MWREQRIPYEDRAKVIEAGFGHCGYCGRPTTRDKTRTEDPDYATIDHFEPLATHRIRARLETNWILACRACNGAKANLPVVVFLAGLETLRRRYDRRWLADLASTGD